MNLNNKPELLAPAGSLQAMHWAAAYGADAVYFGLPNFSLRNFAVNFTPDDAANGLKMLHSLGKAGFATLNIYPFDDEYTALRVAAGNLADMGVDGFIAADIGVIAMLHREFPQIPIHISTQANTVSASAAMVYRDLGATRVNLARELSYEQVKSINEQLDEKIETEVFIHGSVCFSYSGRCAISDYLAGRRANRGQCTQSCRWQYHLVEEKRPGEYIPVFEDDRGLYLFNTKDLALYNYINSLANCGVTALKIEGRMKNTHYLAQIVSLYRQLIDGVEIPEETIQTLISRVSNRGYTEGFMKGPVTPDDYQWEFGGYQATSVLIAQSTEETINGQRVFEVKNSLYPNEELELLTPGNPVKKYTTPTLTTIQGENIPVAQNHHRILLDDMPAFAILRRVEKWDK